MKKDVSEVRDRPAEIWIKLLVAVTMVLVGLIVYMGDKVITGQENQLKEMSKINASLTVYETRISRNEEDIKELESFYHNIKRHGER